MDTKHQPSVPLRIQKKVGIDTVPVKNNTNDSSNTVVDSAWKPNLDRRQSWSKQDQKREMHITTIDQVKTGPGFTEQ